jgi:hypothetical protein
MTDANGRVAPEHLVSFGGIPVSRVIYSDLSEASLDFHRQGFTFSLAAPWGGYRPYDIQGQMRSDYLAHVYSRFNLSPPPSPPPAPAGSSRHGFGLAVDVISNAPAAKRDQIMAAHGFNRWSATDANHYEPGAYYVLTPVPDAAFAGLDQQTLDNGATDMTLSLHKNPNKGDSNFLTNAVTVRYIEVNDGDAAMLNKFGVPWGAPITSSEIDTLDRLRAGLWPASLLAGFNASAAPGGAYPTIEQIQAAAETAVKNVLGTLDGK